MCNNNKMKLERGLLIVSGQLLAASAANGKPVLTHSVPVKEKNQALCSRLQSSGEMRWCCSHD